MSILNPTTVVCCGKAQEGPFSFRDIVLGTSKLVKDIAVRLGSSAKTLKSLPDFYTAIEVAPYLNCIKFAAQWTNASRKSAYINSSLQTEQVSGLSQEDCIKIARAEEWEAQFSEKEDRGHLVFIPEAEELLKRIPGVLYHADTEVTGQTYPDLAQMNGEGTQEESTQLLKELEHVEDRKLSGKQKIGLLEGVLLDMHRELEHERSQFLRDSHDSALLEERCSKLMQTTCSYNVPEKQQTKKEFLQEFIKIASRIIANTDLSSEESPESYDIDPFLPRRPVPPLSDLTISVSPANEVHEQKPIAVFPNLIQCYDEATDLWQPFCTLQTTIGVSESTSYTFISADQIFVCGGEWGNVYLVKNDGTVKQQPNMITGRRWHGIAWNSTAAAIYVFGGVKNGWTSFANHISSCEVFRFIANQWSPLPNMHHSRCCFNPCWHSLIVYLCGGYSTTVETYDPRSNIMTLQDFSLPEATTTAAVMESGLLTVISGNYICKLQEGRLSSQTHECYSAWSNCTPVVSQGTLYLVSIEQRRWSGVDLKTGAVVREGRVR